MPNKPSRRNDDGDQPETPTVYGTSDLGSPVDMEEYLAKENQRLSQLNDAIRGTGASAMALAPQGTSSTTVGAPESGSGSGSGSNAAGGAGGGGAGSAGGA